jgi:hypothetical protein
MRPTATKKCIESKLVGDLQREALNEDCYLYSTQYKSKECGRLTIVLNATNPRKADWPRVARRLDRLLPLLIKTEPRLRRSAIPGIRRLRSRYFDLEDDTWRGSNSQLIASLVLTQINFWDSGIVEMWYSGGEPCQYHDVRVVLGPRLGLRKVAFEG